MESNTEVNLTPYIAKFSSDRSRYLGYKHISNWLTGNHIKHSFIWETSGHYYPRAVSIMDSEDRLAFKLTYGL